MDEGRAARGIDAMIKACRNEGGKDVRSTTKKTTNFSAAKHVDCRAIDGLPSSNAQQDSVSSISTPSCVDRIG